MTARVLVVGGGITGLDRRPHAGPLDRARRRGDRGARGRRPPRRQAADVAVRRRPAVDEGADAFLARVPHATALAREVGLGELTSPTAATAAVWFDGCTRSPRGCCSACRPTSCGCRGAACCRSAASCAPPRSRCSPAATTPTRSAPWCAAGSATRSTSASSTPSSAASTPPTPTASAWRWCRSWRLSPEAGAACCSAPDGAAPTPRRRPDRCSTPRSAGWPTSWTPSRPRPRDGGVTIRTGCRVATLAADGRRWRVDGEAFDAVVLATPAAPTAPLARRRRPGGRPAAGDDGPRRRRPRHARRPRVARAAAWTQRLPRAQAGAAHGDGGVVRLAEVGPLAAAARARCCVCRSGATGCPSTTSTTTTCWREP